MDPESLVQHARGVRALARSLLLDDGQADDVVQEACLAALKRPPGPGVPARAWMVRVVRNLAMRRRRSEARRTVRERAAARSEAVVPAEGVVERAELHETLVRELLRLEEPYRTAVLLRYFDGLAPREIAARLKIPAATVSTRLHRGLARLRGRIDVAILLAVLGLTRRGSTATMGVLAMSAKKTVGLVLLFLLALVFLVPRLLVQESGERSPEAAKTTGTTAATERAEEPDGPATQEGPARVDRDLDLHGRVVDRDGGPVEDARVLAFWLPWRRTSVLNMKHYHDEVAGPETTSAADGSFRLRLTRGQRVNLRVVANGFAPAELAYCQAGERVRVVLTTGVRLHVTAVDAEARPAAGVTLRLFRNEKEGIARIDRRGVTDGEGHYTFDGLPAGEWANLAPQHPRLGYLMWKNVWLPASGEMEVRVEFPPARAITGVVLDADSGRPIEGAVVGENWTQELPVRTGAEGRYEYPAWIGTGVHLKATAEGYEPAKVVVKLQPTIDFRLRKGNRASGRIVDREGAPVAGARIAILTRNSQGHAVADEDGRFLVTGIPREIPATLIVLARGHGRYLLDFDPPADEPGLTELGEVALPAPQRIEGRVFLPDGTPAAGVPVEVAGYNEDRTRLRKGQGGTRDSWGSREMRRTDDLGRFRFADLAPGQYQVNAQPYGYKSVSADAEAGSTGLELRLSGGHELTIVVADEEGRAVQGIFVDVETDGWTMSRRTGVDGRAQFSSDKPVLALAGVRDFLAARYLPAGRQPVPSGTGEIRVTLRRAGRAQGTVLGVDGKPLPQAVLEVFSDGRPVEQGAPFGGNQATADLQGRFKALVPAHGQVDLVLTGYSFSEKVPPFGGGLEGVKAGDSGLVLRAHALTYDRTVRVRVEAPDGSPLAQAQVWAYLKGKLVPGANVRAGRDGVALLRGLPDGQVRIWAKAPPEHPRAHLWLKAWSLALVPAGQDIRLRLEEGSWVAGTVVDDKAKPVPGATVGLYHRGNMLKMGKSDQAGDFELLMSASQPMPVWLHASKWIDGRLWQARLDDVYPDGSKEYELRLEPGR